MAMMVSLLFGCNALSPPQKKRTAGKSASQEVVLQHRAEQALEELRQAYMARDLNGFFEQISENAYLSGTDLRIRISRQFTDFSDIELFFRVDHTLVEGKKVIVRMHWQKRVTVNKAGQQTISSGRADFLFQVQESVQLLDIRGSSPF